MNICNPLLKKVQQPDLGKLVLRVMLGGILILHGIHKMLYGINEVSAMVTSFGLPAFISYGVYIGEVVAPAMLLLGILTRPAAFFIMINMIMAWILADVSSTFKLDDQGGLVIEGLLFYFLSALAIVFLGAGKYAVMKNS